MQGLENDPPSKPVNRCDSGILLTTTPSLPTGACAPARPPAPSPAATHARGSWPRRSQALSGELTALDAELDRLTRAAATKLVAQFGVGTDTAGALLVAAGDNPGQSAAPPAEPRAPEEGLLRRAPLCVKRRRSSVRSSGLRRAAPQSRDEHRYIL
jgi:hypothetical protein